MDLAKAVSLVVTEYQRAANRFPPFQSAHEGHAVIREEFEEHWTEIKAIKWDAPIAEWRNESLATESIQLAAMALRFIVDLIPDPPDTIPRPVYKGGPIIRRGEGD